MPKAKTTQLRAVKELSELGWRPREIATALRVSVATIYRHLDRLESLRTQLPPVACL